MRLSQAVCVSASLVAIVTAPSTLRAASGSVDATMSQAQIEAAIDLLQPGDTLTVAAGTYQGRELDLHHADGSPIVGTSTSPITIVGTKAGDGSLPHFIADTDQFQEAVRFETGDAFITLQDLSLSSVGSTTQAGVRVDEGTHDLTISGCEISDVTGIGIQIETHNDVHDVTIVDNHIHDTGTNSSDGSNGGQALALANRGWLKGTQGAGPLPGTSGSGTISAGTMSSGAGGNGSSGSGGSGSNGSGGGCSCSISNDETEPSIGVWGLALLGLARRRRSVG